MRSHIDSTLILFDTVSFLSINEVDVLAAHKITLLISLVGNVFAESTPRQNLISPGPSLFFDVDKTLIFFLLNEAKIFRPINPSPPIKRIFFLAMLTNPHIETGSVC